MLYRTPSEPGNLAGFIYINEANGRDWSLYPCDPVFVNRTV